MDLSYLKIGIFVGACILGNLCGRVWIYGSWCIVEADKLAGIRSVVMLSGWVCGAGDHLLCESGDRDYLISSSFCRVWQDFVTAEDLYEWLICEKK